MPQAAFAEQLARYGPNRTSAECLTTAQASDYCRRLAQSHYENFTVASWLLPERLRPHFYHLYAYCRWADDLADETRSPDESLALLDWWETQLDDLYAGATPEQPVFIALADTVREFDIPRQPLADLLVAFRQDQRQMRYDTVDELLTYCRDSANPVGRLVLHLGRCCNDDNAALSDSICTGLQLANFWQDIARDWQRGRLYLPREVLRQHGADESELSLGRATPALRAALAQEVDRAEQMLIAGMPLTDRAPVSLRIDVQLFIRGGLEVLKAIRRQKYDVWSHRPTVGKARKLRLLLSSWWHGQRAFHYDHKCCKVAQRSRGEA